jgi:hypothetical protein
MAQEHLMLSNKACRSGVELRDGFRKPLSGSFLAAWQSVLEEKL